MRTITDKLKNERDLSDEEFLKLITENSDDEYLAETADKVRREHFGNSVYIRGLIELSNYCKNDCLYCGIRRSNRCVSRYRMDKAAVLSCCAAGYEAGFRTFVMQGGEDSFYTDDVMCDIISDIKRSFPDCAVTLSLGERSRDSYKRMFDAGADRYLLRHETADAVHYGKLHPSEMSLDNRQSCLFDLKSIGYQTGSGFMVGSPYQTAENILADLRFLQRLNPHMIGIGPFIPHRDTPFGGYEAGSFKLTLRLLSVLRLMFPTVLLPSTTALGTIHPKGREMGLRCGANVIMPNLTPIESRGLYELYDNKLCTGEEAVEGLKKLKESVRAAGYEIVTDRGDAPQLSDKNTV